MRKVLWGVLLLAAVASLWLLAPRGWPARWLGVVCFLPALTAQTPADTSPVR